MDPQLPGLIREIHGSLYFVDGNVALFAKRLQGKHVVFRVHRSILSKLSPVFETMFSLPAGDIGETYDGVPLVYMPDTAEELESLLQVLYHEVPLPFKRLDPRTPLLVKQVLRLANKYDIDYFRRRIVEHMELDWPQLLCQWDILEAEIHSVRTLWHTVQGNELDVLPMYADDHLPEPASAIRLARDCNIPNVLPAAFYHLSRLSIFNDWHGARRSFSSISPHHEELCNGCRTAQWNLLIPEDFICLLKGHETLPTVAGEMLQFASLQEKNEHSHNCNILRRFEIFQEIRDACRRSRDIFRTTHLLMEKGRFGDQICQLCCSSIRDELDSFRQRLWSRLPEVFGLA